MMMMITPGQRAKPIRLRVSKASTGRAFTLIELLVVIAIIALLLALLAPSLDRAKELARRAVCASNLHNYGVGAFQFASDHDHFFPGAMHWNQWFSTIFPAVRLGEGGLFWDDGSGTPRQIAGGYPADGFGEYDTRRDTTYGSFPDHEAWRRFGTSLDTYGEYGVGPQLLNCPSSGRSVTAWDTYGGAWLWADYLFVGGCESNTPSTGVADMPGWVPGSATMYAWNHDPSVPPAVTRLTDASTPKGVLGMDAIHRKGDSYRWNHDSTGSDDLPGPQNLLWGDGHVDPRSDGYYRNPLDDGNFSLASWQDPYNFYYWSQ
jgi:prepilin-type N-terminal cleavage/methylation domain-containing protein